jgi:hypothetical protein
MPRDTLMTEAIRAVDYPGADSPAPSSAGKWRASIRADDMQADRQSGGGQLARNARRRLAGQVNGDQSIHTFSRAGSFRSCPTGSAGIGIVGVSRIILLALCRRAGAARGPRSRGDAAGSSTAARLSVGPASRYCPAAMAPVVARVAGGTPIGPDGLRLKLKNR